MNDVLKDRLSVVTKLPLVREYMATELLKLEPDCDIYDAVDFLLEHRISGAPVVSPDGELVGVLSEKDCLKLLASGAGHERPVGQVSDYMTTVAVTIPSSMDIYFAAGIFLKHVYRRLPVVDNGRLVGQISRRDILKAISERLR
ncbi:MAG: CBS domain-containing protein [Myxococcales bacterium FL481]|nr:MAG: CBS domain-containing protein [Myxococcales bacterium FL481]